MDIRLKITTGGDDGKVYWFKVVALTSSGRPVDRDIFRFPKQTKRILLNPYPDRSNPPPDWKPKLSVPRECNIFDYDILGDIAARHFLRRQMLIERHVAGLAWTPADWQKTVGIDVPPLPEQDQRHVPFLSDRMATMLGAELLVDAPDIAGELEVLEPKPGTVTTISTGFDGHRTRGTDCLDATGTLEVGKELGDTDFLRIWIRYSLSTLPEGDIVTDADVKVKVESIVNSGAVVDLQAYNEDGQANPEFDDCATKYARCSDDASPYLDNDATLQSTSIKTLQLPASANVDVVAAKEAVGRFSIGINENTPTNDNYSILESFEGAGTDEPKLVLTHRPPGAMGAVI